jgi:hypothetical protein
MHATCGAARVDASVARNAGSGVPASKAGFIHGAHRTTQGHRELKRASVFLGGRRAATSQ